MSGHRIDSRILIAFLLLAITSFTFLRLASDVMEGDTLAFDRAILQWLRSASNSSVPAGPHWLLASMIEVTALGGATVLTVFTAIAVGYLAIVKRPAAAVFLTTAIAGGATVSTRLKLGFARSRPEVIAHLVTANSSSFPSGHAMNSAAAYLTLGTLLARTFEDLWVRVYIVGVAIALTLLIGLARVYLGVHWPSDVIAGWCVGAAWAVFCSLVARASTARQDRNRVLKTTLEPRST